MQLHKRADRTGKEPPTNVPDAEGNLPRADLPVGALLEPWPLSHIDVIEANEKESLATSFVDRTILEGWGSLDRGKLILHTKPKLVYKIVRGPGRYCCHCWAPLGNEDEARSHLAAAHPGLESPDPNNPSGWCVNDYYMCEKAGA